MDTEENDEFTWAQGELKNLRSSVGCCMLATVSSAGKPLSSYAPVVSAEDGCFYVYVSAMAKHYGHLRKNGVASLSLIEDESVAKEIFARKRVTVDCEAILIQRDSDEWNSRITAMEERHGTTMAYLKNMVDFDLFQLRPIDGRLVLGFGKAYRVFGDGLANISYLGAGGHRSKD